MLVGTGPVIGVRLGLFSFKPRRVVELVLLERGFRIVGVDMMVQMLVWLCLKWQKNNAPYSITECADL